MRDIHTPITFYNIAYLMIRSFVRKFSFVGERAERKISSLEFICYEHIQRPGKLLPVYVCVWEREREANSYFELIN